MSRSFNSQEVSEGKNIRVNKSLSNLKQRKQKKNTINQSFEEEFEEKAFFRSEEHLQDWL